MGSGEEQNCELTSQSCSKGVNQERKPHLLTQILWFSHSPGLAPPSVNQDQEGRMEPKGKGKRQGDLWVYVALLILI